ncbi:MAG: hypothetical protein ACMG57_04755 [Candidatus Dojkabacteria bacterium]
MNNNSKITKIHLLVHPTYESLYVDPFIETHAIEEQLRIKWWEQAKAVSMSSDSIFMEFTTVTRVEIDYLAEHYDPADIRILLEKVNRELKRIEGFAEMLGDKYFLFSGDKWPQQIDLSTKLADRGLYFSDNVIIYIVKQFIVVT